MMKVDHASDLYPLHHTILIGCYLLLSSKDVLVILALILAERNGNHIIHSSSHII